MNISRARERIEDELDSVVDQIQEGLRRGKYTLQDVHTAIVTKTKDAARTTDAYVHENSWKTIAAVAVLGLAIGLMLQRK